MDVGCGTGEMLRAFREVFAPKRMAGSDLSAAVVQRNQQEMPYATFFAADLAERPLTGSWDLIICSEVIEHIPDYQAALRHLRTMCTGHLIVTVPSGRIFPIDLAMGHHQHFSESELGGALRSTGFRPSVVWRWGFPWHTLYKHVINLSPEAAMNRFSGGAYSPTDKLISRALKTLFYLNSKRMGTQLVVLAKAV